jgi:hypothetical protein
VLGGVTVPQIAGGLFLVLASAAFLGVISIWASTVLRRVQRATVVAYGMVGLLVVGTPIAYGVQFVVTTRPGEDSDSRRESLLLVAPNPFLVTADALGHDSDSAGASPFTPSQAALRRRDERRRGTGGFVARVEERFALDAGEQMAPPAFGNAVPATVAPGPIPVPTTAIASGVPPGFGGDVTSSAPILPTPPAAPFPQRGPVAFDPSTGMAVDPSTGRPVDPSAGVDFGAPPEVFPARSGGDFTDRGPIWAWSFGWWALLGGAAYLHAARKLRLPSAAGVRP